MPITTTNRPAAEKTLNPNLDDSTVLKENHTAIIFIRPVREKRVGRHVITQKKR